ncbi:hypothetical protein BYT27DRAFT_6467653 [Phlegmacium glaucopus]|nr:hypothetical protein BYT27DRAFT_6467653 [Phlegmacium glaucopus]
MRRNRSLRNIHVVLLWMVGIQAPILMAFVPVEGPTPLLSSPGSIVLTATAATRPLIDMIDNQGSSSFQPSDSGTPTTSSVYASSSTTRRLTDSIRHISSAAPIVAGILSGIIVITTIVVICFLKRRTRLLRRSWHSHEARISLKPDSHLHQHSRNRLLGDDISSGNDAPPQQRYHRHSRHSRNSGGALKLNVRNSTPQIVIPPGDRSRSTTHKNSLSSDNREPHSTSGSPNSTFSSTLYTNKIGVDHQAIDGRLSEPLPLQSPSSSSRNDELLNPHQHPNIRNNSSALPPEVRQQHLNTLIQQRAALLLASEDTSDKNVYNKRLLLEEQIQILRHHQNESPPDQDYPPPYEGHG